MTLCQNDSETAESIKEAKPVCAHSIQEANTLCSTGIREGEAQGASQAGSLQQLHAKTCQHLEKEAIKEESKGQLNFLSACQATLWASPTELHGTLVASYHILLGHALTFHPFSLSQGASPSGQGSAYWAPSPPAPEHSPRPKWWDHSPDPVDVLPPSGITSKATPDGPTSLKQWEVMPLHKVLTWSCQEAFGWDSSLVRKMREEYFRSHCPNFNNKNSCDFTDIFWCMTETTHLLGSAIYEIKEAWTGQDELWQANYALRTLLKGLKFLRAVSPSESPKVMGLMGIHDLDALCHFNGLNHCPWCGKEGQNEGTVVNHLLTVHYKLGLVCEKYFSCQSVMLQAICHYGQKNC